MWTKYSKDIETYVDKRAHLELEYTAKLAKLASATKAAITEEVSPKSCSSLTETSLVLACSGNVLSRTDLCSNYHSVFIREGGRGIP